MLKVANSVIDASRITGVLPVANGGTGVTTSTGTGNTVLSATPTLSGDVNLSTGNLVIGTSGKGIDFSADPSAPGMTSELLDDYEEGTWTPTLKEGTNTLTVGTAYGQYTKIGRLVTVNINLENITSSGAGNLTITNAPFVAESTGTNGGFEGATRYNQFTVPVNSFAMVLEVLTNTIYIYWTRTGSVNSLQVTASDIASAQADIYATIQYIV